MAFFTPLAPMNKNPQVYIIAGPRGIESFESRALREGPEISGGQMRTQKTRTVEHLHLGARKALRQAVAEALEEHKSAGVPAAIWKDGKVAYLPARRKK